MTRRGTRSPVERQEPTPQIRMSCKQYARARKALDDMAADHVECCADPMPERVAEPDICGAHGEPDRVCHLLAGHAGKHNHDGLRWDDKPTPEPKSCGDVNGDAVCSLPLDHHGRHRGDLTSWENP